MLVLGKRRTKADSQSVGGAIILFEQLISYFRTKGVIYTLIDTNYRNYGNKIYALLKIYRLILFNLSFHRKIFVNGSNSISLYFIPFIHFCRVFKKNTIIVRFFGGHFDNYLRTKSWPIRLLILWSLRKCALVFFETKFLVNYFSKHNIKTEWFPNVRNGSNNYFRMRKQRPFSRRFIFLGHVREEKGITDLLKVVSQLPDNIHLDIFGPIVNYKCPSELSQVFSRIYKGPVKSDEVVDLLSQYDVLVLPSYKEGYPGVIIEALSIGMPVIATKLRGIQEMVDSSCAILFEVGNQRALADAIMHFNSNNYTRYCSEAYKAFSKFDSEKQMPRILRIIDEV